MNFFKSMLSDDLEPENLANSENFEDNRSPKHQRPERAEDEHTNLNSTTSGEVGGGGLWSFGDLVKTLTTRSESVLETYRRDLKEFGSGLRKESDLFREVASRAVKELPSSIEVGTSAIDGVLKSTADIISQGKDVLLEPSDIDDSDTSETVENSRSLNSRVYSRFDSQLNAIQSDVRTYCEDPEDLDDYNKWKLGFVLSDKESEIEKLIGDNGSVESIYKKVVPNEVDDGSFWCRYFFRVYKLKQQEDARANFVRRSLTVDNEEELTWDVDDDEEATDLPEMNDKSKNVSSNVGDDDMEKNNDKKIESVPKTDEIHDLNKTEDKNNVEELKPTGEESVPKTNEIHDLSKIDDKNNVEELKPIGGKTDEIGDVVAVSAKDSLQEEDLEWDEIGDLGDNDEKNVLQGDSPKKDELLKQLNNGEDDDEDLSWDIEDDDDDDDQPLKASSSK